MALESESHSLAASFAACRKITRHHARSFYFSSHTLPRPQREAAYAIYAYCRWVDDAVDEAKVPAAVPEIITRLQKDLIHRHFPEVWGPAFFETVTRYQIPWTYFDDLLTGVALDQGSVRLQTWAELDRYCYHVASVVGLMMTHLFVKPWPELLAYAKDLGTAMQLTNILRDVGEDWSRDRLYLPAEELLRAGVSIGDIAAGKVTPAWIKLMQFQIQRARSFYTRSEAGIRELPQNGCQLTVWMMREIYAGILDEIEQQHFNVFIRRARTSTSRKLLLALRAWRHTLRNSS
jgi:15-cis-phytoene synthase